MKGLFVNFPRNHHCCLGRREFQPLQSLNSITQNSFSVGRALAHRADHSPRKNTMSIRFTLLLPLLLIAVPLAKPVLGDDHCVVASVQPLATDAGLATYRNGGNALDAAIATALTLGVVDNHNSGIGGGCFILVRDPSGTVTAIDGREMAPQAASADMFQRDGNAVPELSTTGPLAVAVPGALAAYDLALRKLGRKGLGELMLPAAKIAQEGFAIDEVYARKLQAKVKDIRKFPGTSAILLKPDGSPHAQGDVLVQADLAKTYRAVAENGIDWFYRGPFATTVSDWMKQNDGILTAADFALYQPKIRVPIVSQYRDWKIVGFPPPSSGGVHVAQILNILEHFDLAAEQKRSPAAAAHLIAEAMKLAFADRAHWLGDADFADVPRGLLNRDYAAKLAKRIDPSKASDVESYGNPLQFDKRFFNRHTTHIAAADSEGYWVAITQTVNTTFGSKVIVPGTGVVLNNEMDDFSSQPGVPNAFGLVGAKNNAVAAGKRPLSSMSPTIVLDANDQPVMTVGAAGGPKIITQSLLTIIRTLDYQQPLANAVGDPRIHHQWRPDSVLAEETLDAGIMNHLKKLGHSVQTIRHSGVTQAIKRSGDGGLIGVSDPRVPGKAAAATRSATLQPTR